MVTFEEGGGAAAYREMGQSQKKMYMNTVKMKMLSKKIKNLETVLFYPINL